MEDKKPVVFTGRLPTGSMRPISLNTATREELLEYFENSYELNEWLFSCIKSEKTFYLCPDRLRLPLIFYYCHTAVVYINKLLLSGLLKERVDKEIEMIMETGVDEMSWDDTENNRMGGSFKWPTVKQCHHYRLQVKDIITDLIRTATNYKVPVTQDSPWWAVWMGIEHERIHFETSSVLIRQLPVDLVEKPQGWKYAPISTGKEVTENPMILLKGRRVELSKKDDNPVWGWDAEYGYLSYDVPDFSASAYKVTNREMLDFVRNGGYERKEFWSEEGWSWRNFRKVIHPGFWVCDKGCQSNCGAALSTYSHCSKPLPVEDKDSPDDDACNFRYRLMFDEIQLPLDWPVVVTHHEAKAFCRWKGEGFRLLTELEHNICRSLLPFDNDILSDPIYDRESEGLFNHNLAFGSSTPVNMHPPTSDGLYDVMGNLWDLCEDQFNGFEGFKSHKFYDDFSTNQFDGRHFVIVGGSWISTGNSASRFTRFAFRQHFQQQAGFRLAKTRDPQQKSPVVNVNTRPFSCLKTGSKTVEVGVGIVELESSNINYLNDTRLKTYQMIEDEFKNDRWRKINSELIDVARKWHQKHQRSRVLVIGCGAGKISFDLASVCQQIVGVDVLSRALSFANTLKIKNLATYSSGIDNGQVLSITNKQRTDNIEFLELTWLPGELTDFNIVLNLICDRVACPEAWLLRTKDLIHENHGKGVGVVASQHWNAERLAEIFEPELKLLSTKNVLLEDKNVFVTAWS